MASLLGCGGAETPASTKAVVTREPPRGSLLLSRRGDLTANGIKRQMGVPDHKIARFEWSLQGVETASGEIRVVGYDVTVDTGGKPGTEYWYIDKAAKTGVATKFTLRVTHVVDPRVDPWPGFVNREDAIEAPLRPSWKFLDAQDQPAAVVGRGTPLITDGTRPGHAALVFEIVSDRDQQKAPLWYWKPHEQPNLFGMDKLRPGLEFEMTTVAQASEGFPKTHATDPWRMSTE
jgi:hypothetical protein